MRSAMASAGAVDMNAGEGTSVTASPSTIAHAGLKACRNCSRRKTKCSGGMPCTSCRKLGSECDYLPPQRRGPKKRKSNPGKDRGGTRDRHDQGRSTDAQTTASGSSMSSAEITTDEADAILLLGRMLSQPKSDSNPLIVQSHGTQPCQAPQHVQMSTRTGPADGSSQKGSFPATILSSTESYIGAGTTASDHSSMMTTASAGTHEEEFARRLYHVQRPDVQYFSRIARDMEPEGNLTSQLNTPFNRRSPATSSALADGVADQPEVQKLLYDLYWAFVHPLWPLLYRPAFDREKVREQDPGLHYAILSIVGRFDVARQLQDVQSSGDPKVVLSEIGEIYYQRALASLDLQDVCGIRQIQALCLLSLREIAQGNTMSGWMHSGIAIRAALGLQLNQNARGGGNGKASGASTTKGLMSDSPALSIRQQEDSRVIWVCYALDKIVSLFQGRPYALRCIDMDTPLPSHQESDEYSFWMDDARSIVPHIANRFVGVRAHSITTFNAWVRLIMILEKVTDNIYKQSTQSTSIRNASLSELHDSVERWSVEHDDLCKQGQRFTQCPVNVSMVMLWRAGIQLIIHRPFLPSTAVHPTIFGSKTSRQLCEEAANVIVGTVRALDETFGIYRMPHSIVFLCVSRLNHNTARSTDIFSLTPCRIFQAGVMQCITNALATDAGLAKKSGEFLKECISWLDQMSAAYRFTPKYRQVLSQLAQLASGRSQWRHEIEPSARPNRIIHETNVSTLHLDGESGNACEAEGWYSHPTAAESSQDHQANLLSNFLDSMWDIPLDLPLDTDDWSRWDSWQDEYAVLQDNISSHSRMAG